MAEDTSSSETTEETETSSEEPSFIDYQTIPTYESQCVPEEPGPAIPVVDCPTCVPNPAAPNIDWTKTTENEPFLNKRKCTYSINLRTKYEGTGGESTLQARLDEYTKAGAIRLLAHFNKALDENTVAIATKLAGATDHFIPPRRKLKMRVLIEIPANEFDMLPNSSDVPEISPEIEEAIPPREAVQTGEVEMQDFDQQVDKLVEGLRVYAKYQAIYYQTQRGSIRFPGGAPVNLNTEADYLRKVKPILYEFLRTKGWVLRESRGESGRASSDTGLKEANNVEFGLAEDGTLERIIVTAHGSCRETPSEYKAIQISSLRGTEPFNRPTTLHWLINIQEAVGALIQRQGMMKWTDFAQKFVFPTPVINQGADMTSAVSAIASAAVGQATEADLDAITNAVGKMTETEKIEAKTPGSLQKVGDKLNSVRRSMGIPDAETIGDHLTSPAPRERTLTEGAFAEVERNADQWPYKSTDPNSPTYRGPQQIWDPTLNDGAGGYRMESESEAHNRSNANLAAENAHLVTSGQLIEGLCDDPLGAVGQYFADLGDDFMNELFSIWDAVMYQFHNFICMSPEEREEMLQKLKDANSEMMSSAVREALKIFVGFFEMLNTLQYNLAEIQNIEGLYRKGLDEITFCGLFDLMLAFLDCLMQGFALDEVLEVLIAAALASMPAVELEKVFVGLPPEDQAQILAKVEAAIGAHTLPWQSKVGDPDPVAEAPFSNRPSMGNKGSNIAWGGPGSPVAKEKAESRQSQTAVTPALQALARGFEDAMRASIKIAREFETKVRQESIEDPHDTRPAATIVDDVRTEYFSGEEYFGLGYYITDSFEVSVTDQAAMTHVLSIGQHANALAGYFTEYEIEGYKDAGITGEQIASASGDYISALQDLINRVNSAHTVTNSTDGSVDTPAGPWTGSESDDPFPDKSDRWKNEYYAEYSRSLGALQAEAELLPEPARSEQLAVAEAGADTAARLYADSIEALDKGRIGDPGPFGTRGSLGAALGGTVSVVLQEYIKAILEYYSEKGFDALMDVLEDLPGAAIVAKIIALLDCAIPPLWDPPLLDFLNTLEIDFCNMVLRLVAPGPPNLQMPNWKDFFRILLLIAYQIAIYIIFRLLLWLLTKIVMILFDSLCSMLEKLAEAAMNAVADQVCAELSEGGEFAQNTAIAMEAAGHCEDPPRGFLDMVKGAFCGPDATDEEAQTVANNAMRGLGSVTAADAAKMANEGAVTQLIADISTVLTGGELTNLLLGNYDPVATSLVQEVVESENPVFASVLGSNTQIADLFKNIGNLLPHQFKMQLRATQDEIPAVRPANPMLCKTKDELDEFRNLREQILLSKDGTTPEQAQQQFDAMRGRALNDISQIADIMQGGVENFIENNMPPYVGEPDENGCIPADALVPRDPPLMMDLIGAANEGLYDIVGRAYARDINGRGGFMSMILSDTLGFPWRRHQFESIFNRNVVDYEMESLKRFGIEDPETLAGTAAEQWLKPIYQRERGHYPKYVGQYFKEYLRDSKHNPDGYVSTSEFTPTEYSYFNVEDVPLGSMIGQGAYPRDDRGNYMGTEENPFVSPGAKSPDLVLKFRDNARGIKQDNLSENLQFIEGFNLEYGSYIIEDNNETATPVTNIDNVYHLRVVDVTNPFMNLPAGFATASAEPDFDITQGVEDVRFELTITGSLTEEAEALRNTHTLDTLPLSPQINCWNDFLHKKYSSLGLTDEQVNQFNASLPFAGSADTGYTGHKTHDNMMNTLLDYFANMIAGNSEAYEYGFTPGTDDDLTATDKMYMSPDGDKPFMNYILEDLAPELGDSYMIFGSLPNIKKISKYIEDNQIMGQSNHARMHFLNPADHGGSWLRPPYYIEPPKYEGWLGIRDLLLPEVDGKEPKRYPVCNFEDIKERVDELTKKMPDDPRLAECPDCVIELPYSRILDRSSAAGMEGPIIAMIRIYCVEELIKAMPMFSKFKAKIPEVLDYTYVEYILATMKEDFMQNLSRKGGFLRGEALWYTFLEQCVQSFARQMQLDGREVKPEVQKAIDALNALQEDFHYPSEDDLHKSKMKSGLNPWRKFGNIELPVPIDPTKFDPEVIFGRKVGLTTKLHVYQRWHLLQAVKDTEEHANVIVRVLIEEQLEYMAERFVMAMSEGSPIPGLVPDIDNIYEYFIGESGFVAGHSEYSLKKSDQPLESPKIFDVGASFSPRALPGLDSGVVPMTNPLEQYETNIDTDKLDVQVKINDDGYYSVGSYKSRFTNGEFFLEKYVRVTDKNGMGMTVSLPDEITNRPEHIDGVVNVKEWKQWLESISEQYGDNKLSDFFGNLEFTYANDRQGNPTEEVTGIEGEMGIRYGLRLCYIPPESCVEQLDALFKSLKESENWSYIYNNMKKEKAYYVTPANLQQSGLNVTGITLADAEEGSPGELTDAAADQAALLDIWSGERGTSIRENELPYLLKNSKYIIPLASAEYDALDHTINQHIMNIDFDMDLYCLGQDIVKSPEFEMLFQYVFPLNRLVSLMGIYTSMGFVMSIGEKTQKIDLEDMLTILGNGIPVPDNEAGEWHNYAFREALGGGFLITESFDDWDMEFFKRTKRRLVKMFRSYYKSRDWLDKEDDEQTSNEKDRSKNRDDNSGKKKRGGRKFKRRRRDRPYNKFGEL